MHIELTELLRCPEPHGEAFLVMSTGEMVGRMVRSGILGCPICRREFPIVRGIVNFSGSGMRDAGWVGAPDASHPASRLSHPAETSHPASRIPHPVDSETLQALLDLSGPGGFVVLVGSASRHAEGLAARMAGIHFVGVNAPPDIEELPVLSLLECDALIPLRPSVARSVVVGGDAAQPPWLAEAHRVLLRGRRLVIEHAGATPPEGVKTLAVGQGLWVGEKA